VKTSVQKLTAVLRGDCRFPPTTFALYYDLVDAVFEAGLELAKEIGAYSRSTERVISFESGEIEEGMRAQTAAGLGGVLVGGGSV